MDATRKLILELVGLKEITEIQLRDKLNKNGVNWNGITLKAFLEVMEEDKELVKGEIAGLRSWRKP